MVKVIGRMIREARGKRSQREIAQIADVEQVQISAIENQKVDPRLSTVIRVARAVGLDSLPLTEETSAHEQETADALKDVDRAEIERFVSWLESRIGASPPSPRDRLPQLIEDLRLLSDEERKVVGRALSNVNPLRSNGAFGAYVSRRPKR